LTGKVGVNSCRFSFKRVTPAARAIFLYDLWMIPSGLFFRHGDGGTRFGMMMMDA
jgi:hypothetical protein